jgi:hypothetical protein
MDMELVEIYADIVDGTMNLVEFIAWVEKREANAVEDDRNP